MCLLFCLMAKPTYKDFNCVLGVLGATPAEIEQHLEMGRKLLAAGQLAEALSHYHSAVGETCIDICTYKATLNITNTKHFSDLIG